MTQDEGQELAPALNINFKELKARLSKANPNEKVRFRLGGPHGPHLWMENRQLRNMGIAGMDYDTMRYTIIRLGTGHPAIETKIK